MPVVDQLLPALSVSSPRSMVDSLASCFLLYVVYWQSLQKPGGEQFFPGVRRRVQHLQHQHLVQQPEGFWSPRFGMGDLLLTLDPIRDGQLYNQLVFERGVGVNAC
jgi:hypothetical protein